MVLRCGVTYIDTIGRLIVRRNLLRQEDLSCVPIIEDQH